MGKLWKRVQARLRKNAHRFVKPPTGEESFVHDPVVPIKKPVAERTDWRPSHPDATRRRKEKEIIASLPTSTATGEAPKHEHKYNEVMKVPIAVGERRVALTINKCECGDEERILPKW